MATVFISYNRESRAIAKTLAADVDALGHLVWFDQEISGGRTWWDEILRKVRECDVFIFVLDPQSLDSVACKREYNYAAALGKSILPVLVSDEVATDLLPPTLARIQFVDYREANREAAFRLARALMTIPTSAALPEPLPTPPDAPISYLGSLTERVESPSLTLQDQNELLADVRRSLRDPETFHHGQRLLEVLKKRRDLYAVVAEEIDDLTDRIQSRTPPPPVEKLIDRPEVISSRGAISSVIDRTIEYILIPETRLGAALRAGIIGYSIFYIVLLSGQIVWGPVSFRVIDEYLYL